ncbi:MAG: hypothetical protein IH969_00350 [Candidatus Krumholzibacteriota bacterium]|nr:hypothetical protein [Candidatus Krumholzibacteriota bacterium]
MQRIGLILVVLGSLLATWVAVQSTTQINWKLFVPAALVGVIGVAMAQYARRAMTEHVDIVAGNIQDIETSLGSLVEKVKQLNRDKGTINTYDMRYKIDEMLLDDLNTFVEARETISVRYGLHAYADIMSHFAAGERYLNRVWSCSADGYIDEVNTYIARAEDQFVATLSRFQELRSAS